MSRMNSPIRILLQTTIPATEDDWHVGRFSLLGEHLGGLKDAGGRALCEVTARDREWPLVSSNQECHLTVTILVALTLTTA